MKALGPGSTIGVLGGGQLGRMLALEAARMEIRTIVFDADPHCPAGQVAHEVIVGTDLGARELARRVDVITLENEHFPADVLEELARMVPVHPAPRVFRTIQDRLVQKQFLDAGGFPQAGWMPIANVDDVDLALARFGEQIILKTRREGYDGRGQRRVRVGYDRAELARWLTGLLVIAEQVIGFRREISVILARGQRGELAIYPIAENVHRNHVLHTTRAPAPTTETTKRRAEELAVGIAQALDHVGVIAVEMFELADGTLLVNEIAPRTHNSGHYTYGACVTSQFEQHVRAVCGLPLGDARALCGATMVNLLGDLWQGGTPNWNAVLARPDARLHLYGKANALPGRKMGHVVIFGDDAERGLAAADQLVSELASR